MIYVTFEQNEQKLSLKSLTTKMSLTSSVHEGPNSLVLIASIAYTQHAAIRGTTVLLIGSFAYETRGALEKRVTLMKFDLIKRYRANACVWVCSCVHAIRKTRDRREVRSC